MLRKRGFLKRRRYSNEIWLLLAQFKTEKYSTVLVIGKEGGEMSIDIEKKKLKLSSSNYIATRLNKVN